MMSVYKRSPAVRATYRCLRPILPVSPVRLIRNYVRFWRGFFAYRRLQGSGPCRLVDLDAQISDWHSTTPISFYFYQDTWAFHKIVQQRPGSHLDIGSTALLVGCLAGVLPTISLDFRPLPVQLKGLRPMSGSIIQLPFPDDSVESISSLCVIEHIGLGRYGDPLDPAGTLKAARELSRVLAPGGNLYVSAPCGRSYIAFNAHRSFDKEEFISLFPALKLKEFVLVNNRGVIGKVDPNPETGLHVGLFHFTK
jgi:SAM-dependent methyltransferase